MILKFIADEQVKNSDETVENRDQTSGAIK